MVSLREISHGVSGSRFLPNSVDNTPRLDAVSRQAAYVLPPDGIEVAAVDEEPNMPRLVIHKRHPVGQQSKR